jgi:hypothetical protein
MASNSPGHPLNGLSDQGIVHIYGVPETVNMDTGQIDYNIDAFTGCAAGFVLFLDQGQPKSVEPVGHGKAIAV